MQKLLKINDTYEVTILKQDHFGRGIAKLDNLLVFVDKALPLEKCRIEIVNQKKNYWEANIKEIIKKSPSRIKANCPYYDSCGGCHIMHEEREKQLEFKENKVKELLERFTGLKELVIKPIRFSKQFYYRNKIVLHGKDNKLGFYQEKTHEIVPIDTCMITSTEINEIYHKILNYVKEFPNNKLDQIMIRSNDKKEIMIIVDGKIDKNSFIPYFHEVSSIYMNHELIYGNSYLYEEIFGLKFKVYPKSFFQVNEEMMKTMYQIVMDYYKEKNYSLVLDLYCGTGTIGMLVSKYVLEVIGVEVEKESIRAAIECQKENSISNISFYNGKVENLIDNFKNVDSIIVDPPRKGLDKYTLDNILKLNPKSIVYISCDPATLARDLNLLKDNYNIIEVNPIDMFPNTYHVENVVILERKNRFKRYDIIVNRNNLYHEEDFKDRIFTETTDIEGNKILVEDVTYQHYLLLKEKLKEYGIDVSITSGYRSLEDQRKTIEELKEVYKDDVTLYKKVAPVGASEHHTALALDITISNQKQYQNRIKEYYTEEELKKRELQYQLIAKSCSEFGFILRYPKDKEEITGYSYEPWHFRYVGKQLAKEIMDKNIVLEEYYQLKNG